MYDVDFRRQFAQDRLAHLSGDWPTIAPRRRVRLALGRWLIGAGRRLEAPTGSGFSQEALPRC
jgi:hypothetical protein